MARNGKMYDKTIESLFLKEPMTLKIYEPLTIDPMYETTICIMQDGDDYFQIGRIATLSDKLHEEYEITNAVFVGIHYIDRFDRLKKYHPDGEQYEAYIKFLTEEVVPLCDELVSLNPLGVTRALIGDSLAGTVGFMTAIRFPDLFQKVLMQSPLVNDAVLEAAKQIENIAVYHSIGLAEESVGTTRKERIDFLTPNQKLNKIISGKISAYYYFEIQSGNHTWKYWQAELPNALTVLL